MPKTTRKGLQERQDAPLILTTSAESFNAKNDQNSSSPAVRSMSLSHCGSGYNSILQDRARVSGHSVFVLNVDGEPLTPCKPSKARKLLKDKQAKPVWNKFGMFGIQMLRRVGNKQVYLRVIQKITEWNLDKNVVILGKLQHSEVLRWLAGANVSVVAEQWFSDFGPLTIYEATKLGVPVVSGNLGAAKEFTKNIVKYNEPKVYAKKIISILEE